MMRELIYRPEALVGLNEAESYTKQTWGGAQAKRYVATLVADIKALRVSALRYPLYDDIYPRLRRKRSGMHHIYYIAAGAFVEVLNVVHVSRDPGLHLKAKTWRKEEGE